MNLSIIRLHRHDKNLVVKELGQTSQIYQILNVFPRIGTKLRCRKFDMR